MGVYSVSRDVDIIGWKKVLVPTYDTEHFKVVVAKLIIPKYAQVVFGDTKCRASQAIVDGFYPTRYVCLSPSPDEELRVLWGCSYWDRKTVYIPGEHVIPDGFDPDPMITCSNGIHFFRSYPEAVDY